MQQGTPQQTSLLALGIDAGGTATRWALASPAEGIVAEGQVLAISALDLKGPGQAGVAATLETLAQAVLAVGHPVRVHAGLTGLGITSHMLVQLLATPLGLPAEAITLSSDIEIGRAHV